MTPPRTVLLGLAILTAAALAGCTAPQESQAPDEAAAAEHRILAEPDIEWQQAPSSLPPGARVAVLSGDPSAEGPFTMRATFPAGYEVPPHVHPSTEHVTILSGTGHLAMGEGGTRESAAELPPGSFFMMPPGTVHAFYAGDEPVVLQIHGTGPWGIEYVEPVDGTGAP